MAILEDFLPSPTLVSLLPQSWEKSKRLAVAMGMWKFCCNAKGKDPLQMGRMHANGKMFLMKVLGIHFYKAFDFFKYNVNGSYPVDVGVLLRDDCLDATPSVSNFQDMLESMREVGAKEIYNGFVSNSDLMIMVDTFKKWSSDLNTGMPDIGDMFLNSWGEAVMMPDGVALFTCLAPGGKLLAFEPLDAVGEGYLIVDSLKLNECEGCNMDLPCVKSQTNGQTLCRACLATFRSSTHELQSCNHIECSLFGCPRYKDIAPYVTQREEFI
jgi:hypothetical protein